jgi:predicted DNA-binding protein
MKKKEQALRLRISTELKEELKKLSDRDSRNLSDYIRLKLEELVQKEKQLVDNKSKKIEDGKVYYKTV